LTLSEEVKISSFLRDFLVASSHFHPLHHFLELSHGFDISRDGAVLIVRSLHGWGLARGDSLSRFFGVSSGLAGFWSEFGNFLGDFSNIGALWCGLGFLGRHFLTNDLGFSRGTEITLQLGESSLTFFGNEDGLHIESSGLSLLELPGVEGASVSEGDDSGTNAGLLGGIWERISLDGALDSGCEALVGIVLDESLDFIISVDVNGPSGEHNFTANHWFEGFDDELDFDTTVGGEVSGRVGLNHLEGPVGDKNNLGLEVGDLHVRVLGAEFVNCLLGEIAWEVEEVVGDEEVWESLLDVALDLFLWDAIGELGEISSDLEDFVVELLESGLLGHF